MATKAELKARLSLDSSLFVRGTRVAHEATSQLGSTFQRVGSTGIAMWGKLAGVIAAIGGASGFVMATKRAYDLGRELTDLKDRTGISVQNLVVLQEAFRHAGLEADDLGTSINRMQRFIASGGVKKFGADFLAIRDAKPEEQFMTIAKNIMMIPNAAQRAQMAMEIFGRGGGRLLAVFGNVQEMGRIQQAIGNQALLLGRNAEAFRRVSVLLTQAGTQIRGFFVGFASGILRYVGPILERLARIDLTGVGERFGQALLKGINMLVGFFKNSRLFTEAFDQTMNAAVLGLGNVMLAVFKAAISFFQDGMMAAIKGIGNMLVATFIQSFHNVLSKWAEFEYKFMLNLYKGSQGIDPLTGKQGKPSMIARGLFQAWGGEKEMEYWRQTMEAAKAGGTEAVTEATTQGAKQLQEALSKAADALRNIKMTDMTNATQAWQKAIAAMTQAMELGADTIAKAFVDTGEQIRLRVRPMLDWWEGAGRGAPMSAGMQALHDVMRYKPGEDWIPGVGFAHSLAGAGGREPWKMLQPSGPVQAAGGLVSGSLAQAPGSWFFSGIGAQGKPGSEPIFRRDTLLSHAEQAKIMNEMVAMGMPRPVAFPGAYNAVAAGDYQRRRRMEQAIERREVREKLGLQTSADLLHEIADNTRETAQALADEGQ